MKIIQKAPNCDRLRRHSGNCFPVITLQFITISFKKERLCEWGKWEGEFQKSGWAGGKKNPLGKGVKMQPFFRKKIFFLFLDFFLKLNVIINSP